VQVVYGDWYAIDREDRITERHAALAASRGQLITEGFFCNAQAMFWRSTLHERFGEFDLQLHYTMDYDLMLRLISLAGRRAFCRTSRPLGCFRVYPGQKTGSADDRVSHEHRLIAQRRGTTWKYDRRGYLLRQFFRGKRITEHLCRGRAHYLWTRLAARMGRPS
jgi:hypothetical protein